MKLVTWRTLPDNVQLPAEQRWATCEVDKADQAKQDSTLIKTYGPDLPPPDGKVYLIDLEKQPAWTVTLNVKAL